MDDFRNKQKKYFRHASKDLTMNYLQLKFYKPHLRQNL